MVGELFDSLLEELGRAIKVPDLQSENNTCALKMPNGLEIQLEMDKKGDHLIIGTDLGEVPIGRFREDVFREAMKANGMPHPRNGIFAYSRKSDHLVVFEKLPAKNLTGDKIADALVPFMEKALRWKESLEKEEVPIVSTITTTRRAAPGMLGLR